MHEVLMDGLPVAKFESKDFAELGKLLMAGINREVRDLRIKEVM